MAKKPVSRIVALSARIEKHLTQFEPMDDESDYSPVSRQEEKKKRYGAVGPGMAAAAVTGGAAIAMNKDKIKAGAKNLATRGVNAGGRALEGAGAKVSNTGIDAAAKLRKMKPKAGEALENAAIKGGNKLIKGGKFLKKVMFSRELAQQLVRIEKKVRSFEAV